MQGYWDAARCPRRPEKASAKRKPEATVKIPSQNKRAKKKYNCLIYRLFEAELVESLTCRNGHM